MAIGLIIIGDEILSGKRADKHFSKVVELLSARGLQLGWTEIIGDDPERITATLQRTMATSDIVFCCGGIGATPDDHTRQCAAAALGVDLELHPEAKTLIQQRITQTLQEAGKPVDLNTPDLLHRLKMGEFPKGSSIIPNSYNLIPGFFKASHYFVPGFPVMAEPMLTWVLDTHYSHLFHQHERAEKSVLIFEIAESTLTPLMEQLEIDFPLIKVFSLPSVGNHQIRRHIELGVKGQPTQVEQAFAVLEQELELRNAEYVPA
ncbi:competence/damage-inducible protein A [Solimicrobium silvestre]|uniref:Putative nucleotide-utilizing enzyme related to molybdopterin-biosynthesis enzyme MoeA n=1 Tax=Solimicrobium silvestre TaxID=2099400 RepID=A0A2S9GZ14_9BURK|nr:molybdopterin-binding protein [Solimicrobium silvestre]PRC92950.1 putative nucleotide-utilizing enzyme related to molybdopterin-biosynthesis enzyme MoeA [Solimicrobium silvestre]